MSPRNLKSWTIPVVVIIAALAVACAGAAPATQAPPQSAEPTAAPASTTGPASTSAPAASAGPTPAPTAAPVATPLPSDVTSARDSITLVGGKEPVQLNPMHSIGASLNAVITRDNLVDALAWQ